MDEDDLPFRIPQRLEDLCTFSNAYVVPTELSAAEVTEKIHGLALPMSDLAADYIIEHFEVFYGVLKHFNELESNIRDQAWHIAIRGIESFTMDLEDDLNSSFSEEDGGVTNRKLKCKKLKMLVYVLCTIMVLNEELEMKNASLVVEKGRKKPTKKTDKGYDWERCRDRGLKVIMKICLMSIHKLFSPPIVEDDFTDVTTKTCYKVLENPSVAKKDHVKEAIFQIIANAVSKHNHGYNFCLKIIQLIQAKETLCKDLATIVELVVKDHGQKNVVKELMLEIEHLDMNCDSNATKSVAEFLRELGDRLPKALVTSTNILIDLLDCEAYNIRSAVLSVMGSIVIEISRELTDKNRKIRDELLDKLEEHIHDTTTFTRGRAIQVWTKFCSEKKIPKERMERLVPLIVGRLKDKAVYVRKQAVVFLTEFLKSNPYAAGKNIDWLKENYEKEKEKLASLRNQSAQGDQLGVENWINKWPRIEKDLYKYWKRRQEADSDEEEEENEHLENGFDSNSVEASVGQIRNLLIDGKFGQLLNFIQYLKNKFEDHEVFQENDESEDEDEDSIPSSLTFAKRLFLFNTSSRKDDITEEELKRFDKRARNSDAISEEPATDLNPEVLVNFLHNCILFHDQIQIAVPDICSMLYSPTISDAQVAIDFFVAAHEYGVPGAVVGIRKMIVLIFSKDKAVQDAVLAAFKTTYLENSKHDGRQSVRVVKSLIEFVEGANAGEMTSLEELLKKLVESSDLRDDHINVLFEKFAKKNPDTTDQESRAACQIIRMLAGANKHLILGNIDIFIDVVLGQRSVDSLLARTVFMTLQEASTFEPKVEKAAEPFRLEQTHRLFQRVHELVVDGFNNLEDEHYMGMTSEAIRATYLLSEHPDAICEDILKEVMRIMIPGFYFDSTKENEDQSNVGSQSTRTSRSASIGSQTITEVMDEAQDIDSRMLTRLMSLLGDIAINQLLHLELSVVTEVKIRKHLKDLKEAEKKSKKGLSSTAKKRMSTPLTAEEEIGLAGATATEDEIDQFRVNRLLDDPKNILCLMADLVIHVISNPDLFTDPLLKVVSVTTLAKFMMCSQNLCQNNLRLLFTLLTKHEDPIIRKNITIALGDLCVRYPNLLDSWTSHLYSPLNDKDTLVKRSALKVLSRLILSDMIKVKGQISEIARLIADDDKTLSSQAILFFQEYKKKENAVYNVLPDIISNLSGGDEEMMESKFQDVMNFLLPLVEKERHVQCLIEKICERFRATTVERQWRDLAFCLTIIKYNESRLLRLYERMDCFAAKLPIDFIYDAIVSIIDICRKFQSRSDTAKATIDEFQQKVEECRMKGLQNEDESEIQKVIGTPPSASKKKTSTPLKRIGRKPAKASSTKKKSAAKTSTRTTRRRKASSDEEEDHNQPSTSGVQTTVRQSSRTTRARKNIAQIFEDDEDESD